MDMDSEKVKAAMRLLAWEARYRCLAAGQERSNHFLPAIEGLDYDFAMALKAYGLAGGRLLDIGTGTGTQAVALAELGFQVTATDVSETALRQAQALAAARGLTIETRLDDIVATRLEPGFAVICDRGCLTLLPEKNFDRYAATVARLLAPGGLLLLKMDRTKLARDNPLPADFTMLQRTKGYYSDLEPREATNMIRSVFFVLQLLPRPE